MEQNYMHVLAIVAMLIVSSTPDYTDGKYSYWRGSGRSLDIRSCPGGLRDDGSSCWSDPHIYGKGCCCTWFGCCNNCRSGYHDDGCTCRKTDIGIKITLFQRQKCNSEEERYGELCYPKCKVGYHPIGCCICEPDAKF